MEAGDIRKEAEKTGSENIVLIQSRLNRYIKMARSPIPYNCRLMLFTDMQSHSCTNDFNDWFKTL